MYHLESGMSEAGFKECMNQSGKLLVVCTLAAKPGRGNFQGGWQLYALNPETERWTTLNLFRQRRGVNSPRIIGTVNGLCSFIIDAGFPAGVIPYRVGSGIEASKTGDIRYFSRVDFRGSES